VRNTTCTGFFPRADRRVATSGMLNGRGAMCVFSGSEMEQRIVFEHDKPTGFGRGPAVAPLVTFWRGVRVLGML